jgi:cytidine deaminase
MDWDRLLAAATAVRENAYAPYSHFPVGAAILMEDGSIWTGANVENCIPALGTCAERNAMTNAASAGRRKPQAVAVVTDTSPPAAPCGLCRQTISEFLAADEDLPILLANLQGEREETSLGQLLPHRFKLGA